MNAVIDLASPEACAARKARIAAATKATIIRAAEMVMARATIRRQQVRGAHELLAMLNCVAGAFKGDGIGGEYAEKVRELCAELMHDLDAHEPELVIYGSERGEIDAHSRGANYA